MQYESVLTSVIEVGIATAGFSGIIAVLGRRSQGEWRTADLVRMSILLQASFAAILSSFLPMVLDGAGLSESTVWRIASACFIAYAAMFSVRRLRQIRRAVANDPSVSPGFFLLMFPVIMASAVLVLYNALFLYKGWPFILAIMLELVVAFAMFVRLLRLLWDEPAV